MHVKAKKGKRENMQLAHIGFPIAEAEDIDSFYIELLEMSLAYQFEIPAAMTYRLFGVSRSVPVYMMKKDDIVLELFCTGEMSPRRFDHICFWVTDRAELIQRFQQKGYPVDIIPRSEGELIFVFDRSGNRFEIKQSAQ